MSDRLHVYDTTLRDGAQGEGITFTVDDKIAIMRLLDELGVDVVEGGWPGASPKDTEAFRRARTEVTWRHATLAAFGATRKPGLRAADDPQVAALRDSGAGAVTIVAKAHLWQVTDALRTTAAEALAMVRDTVTHLRAEGLRVFVDCEHAFDGYAFDSAFTTEVIRTIGDAGAEVAVLCDTNGGTLPWEVVDIVERLAEGTGVRLGIHCHDDTGCAVASTLMAVRAGATHVQGTVNGLGERCGNTDLVAVIGGLAAKQGLPVLPDGRLADLTRISHAIAEIANRAPRPSAPYVGHSAFAHKAGLHASALKVDAAMYNHMDPTLVGNDMRMLISEMAGRATIELKGRELGVDLSQRPEVVADVVAQVKDLESKGWSFEAAEASFELLLRKASGETDPLAFTVESWRTIVEQQGGAIVSEATVKLEVKGERVISTREGNGPVNALDQALRAALEQVYPDLARVELVDFTVRILEGTHGTNAVTRVLVTSTDGDRTWATTGVNENIIGASWQALLDAVRWSLLER